MDDAAKRGEGTAKDRKQVSDDQQKFGLFPTGVEMYQAVRARLRALVCGMRAARRDAGMVTSEYAMGTLVI